MEMTRILDERFKRLQTLLDYFWKRWSNGHLFSLRRALSGKENPTPPRIGDVVVVHDGNLGRQAWHIGRIANSFQAGTVRFEFEDAVAATDELLLNGGH